MEDLLLFEKTLRINGLGYILAVESGYEEGCKRGAIFVWDQMFYYLNNMELPFFPGVRTSSYVLRLSSFRGLDVTKGVLPRNLTPEDGRLR